MPQSRRTLVIYPPGDTIPILIDVFAHGHQVTQGRDRLNAMVERIIAEEIARERAA